ncbi:MAG TPA: hypothetical protein VGD37_02815 [Kofleriaceae bacterium]
MSRTTYERLKAFCETNSISMSQLVETRVNDFLGNDVVVSPSVTGTMLPASPPRPLVPRPTLPSVAASKPVESRPQPSPPAAASSSASGSATGTGTGPGASGMSGPPGVAGHAAPAAQPPMTSAAARFAVDPPPPIIKPRQDTAAPKPAEKRPEQIFTF